MNYEYEVKDVWADCDAEEQCVINAKASEGCRLVALRELRNETGRSVRMYFEREKP